MKTLLDSCYMFYLIHNEHQQKEIEKIISQENIELYTTSFNIHEMLYHHKIKKHLLTNFLEKNNVNVIEISVVPGNQKLEEEYVKSIEPKLLEIIPDTSDAVIVATAIKEKMNNLISRDRRHLFNSKIDEFLKIKNIKINQKI